jgi:hypothetical protein
MGNLPVVNDGCPYYRTKGSHSLDLLAEVFVMYVINNVDPEGRVTSGTVF